MPTPTPTTLILDDSIPVGTDFIGGAAALPVRPAATIAINRWAKPEPWTEQEWAEPALYAQKVTVDRAHAGHGLGAELLDWAGTRAADEGAGWPRVDVWTTNEHLQHYYLKQGFTYVRTVVLPHNPSGALFLRPAERVPTPHLQEVESLTG
jgi:GNAT superfamily N-acetyltransferase